ncbi:MAG TPA: twin-arginine translocase TatA/TatE family subunit [Verrucomicrobiae bacterium]
MNTAFFALGLGMPEVIGILVIVLVLFGAKKIPELAKGLGQGIKEFKKASNDMQDELHRSMQEPPPQSPPPAPRPVEPRKIAQEEAAEKQQLKS